MSQAGPVSQSRAPGSAAVTLTLFRIIENAADFEISDSGTAGAVIVRTGGNLQVLTSGTAGAILAGAGANIRIVEV